MVQALSVAGPAKLRPNNASRSGWTVGTSPTASGRKTHRQWRKFRICPLVPPSDAWLFQSSPDLQCPILRGVRNNQRHLATLQLADDLLGQINDCILTHPDQTNDLEAGLIQVALNVALPGEDQVIRKIKLSRYILAAPQIGDVTGLQIELALVLQDRLDIR